jgi:hypothetical protein
VTAALALAPCGLLARKRAELSLERRPPVTAQLRGSAAAMPRDQDCAGACRHREDDQSDG